jgi:hypothetical protein
MEPSENFRSRQEASLEPYLQLAAVSKHSVTQKSFATTIVGMVLRLKSFATTIVSKALRLVTTAVVLPLVLE